MPILFLALSNRPSSIHWSLWLRYSCWRHALPPYLPRVPRTSLCINSAQSTCGSLLFDRIPSIALRLPLAIMLELVPSLLRGLDFAPFLREELLLLNVTRKGGKLRVVANTSLYSQEVAGQMDLHPSACTKTVPRSKTMDTITRPSILVRPNLQQYLLPMNRTFDGK